MTDASPMSADEVVALYEKTSALVERIWGDNLHFGYWTGPDDQSSREQAQERLTDMMIEQVPLTAGQRLLDVGSGLGRPALRFAQATGADVVGVTITPPQVESANELARAEGLQNRVTFHLADAMTLPFPTASFDGAWALESMPHMSDRAAVLREIARVLRPGARLALTDVTQRTALSQHQLQQLRELMMISIPHRQELLALLRETGFEVIEVIDITANSNRTTEVILEVLHKDGDELERLFGAELITHMKNVQDAYIDAVNTGMEYLLISVRRLAPDRENDVLGDSDNDASHRQYPPAARSL